MILGNDTTLLKNHYNSVQYTMSQNFGENLKTNGMDVQAGCIHIATLAVSTVLVIFVLFLGCTGNGIVLFNALTARHHRNNFELLVINLAGADFIMCTCLSPMFLFLLFSDSDIPRVFCGSVLFLGVLSALLSLFSLVAIAVYRQCQILGTLSRPLSLVRMSVLVAVIWVSSTLTSLGATFHVTTSWQVERINECQNAISNNKTTPNNFVLYFISPVTIISLLTIAVCYTIIARTARRASRCGGGGLPFRGVYCQHETNCEDIGTDKTTCVSIAMDKCIPSGSDLQSDNGQKATTICLVVTLTVVLCWGPLIISQFIQLFTGQSIILYQVKLCGIALIFLNSALNPYLYGQYNSKVKYRYIRALYNLAKCDYSLSGAKHCIGKDGSEKCPLEPSHHGLSGHLSCVECESQSHTVDVPLTRQYVTNIQYANSLLLLAHQEGPVVTTLITGPIDKMIALNV